MAADAIGVPLATTRLIGRESEVATVAEMVRDPSVRLVTLTGTGGVGKTRLALEAARRLESGFAGQVRFVSLAPLADAEVVPSAVGRAIGLVDSGDRPLDEQLVEMLGDRELLLVLDNFEHLLDAAPLVGHLVASCPQLTVLATSRAPLKLSGEHEHEVPPLALPPDGATAGAKGLDRFPAVALFCERARSATRDFQLDDDNAGAVVAVCLILDGVPLAIELAAARLKLLPAAVLAERLREQPLELLTGGPRDLPSRQRTLRETIEWSYELLRSPEQRLLARLAVFRGGATLSAAEAVGGGGEGSPTDVLASLESLLDAGLIVREASERGEARIRLLEAIREYAAECLEASGEERPVRNAHASAYLALATGAEPKLTSKEQAQWLDRLEADHDNFRSALRWLLDTGKAETALRLAGSLAHFWLMHGYLSEGRAWLAEALGLGDDVPVPVRAKALTGAGVLTHYQNDYGQAEELLDRALGLYRDSGDRRGAATALSGLAMVIGRHRDPSVAHEMYEEALAISREVGDDARIAFLLERLGTVLWYGGDDESARPLLEESEARARALQLPNETAHAIQALGWLCLSEGDPRRARGLLEEARSRLVEIGDRWGAARAVFGLGLAAVDRGAQGEARQRLGEALATVVELNDKLVICGCLGGLAATAAAGRRMKRAAMLLAAAERLRGSLGASHSACVRRGQEGTAAAAREALGGDAFRTTWEEGRALSVTDAVALAHEEAAARRGGYPDGLTEREVEVLRLVASGSTDPEVAESLVVSVRTVHAHLRSVYRKIGVGSRSGATRYAIEHEIL